MTDKVFNQKKHIVVIPPVILAAANQKGGVLVATSQGYYQVKRVDIKNGLDYSGVVIDEATDLSCCNTPLDKDKRCSECGENC